MQGVVMMAGNDSAWGGFASRYTERLRDELGKGVIWVSGVQDTTPSTETRVSLSLRFFLHVLTLLVIGEASSTAQ